jgi:hypothetical protein
MCVSVQKKKYLHEAFHSSLELEIVYAVDKDEDASGAAAEERPPPPVIETYCYDDVC